MQLSITSVRLVLQLAVIATPTWSIHLWDSPGDLPVSVSDACRTALSQNITCSQLISGSKVAAQVPYSKEELTRLCTTSCSDSLKEFEQEVRAGCGNQTLTFNGTSITAAQLAEPLAWAHNVTCLRDTSGFCNPQLFNSSDPLGLCSDCALTYISRMLESEYGRVRFSDQRFSSILSSCGVPATKYPYTTTTSVVAPSSALPSSTSAGRVCDGHRYTVAEDDSCQSIAKANSIPLGTFLADNGIDQNCTTLRPGSEVCLSPPCKLYSIKEGDTCRSIITGRGFYLAQFLSWNPYGPKAVTEAFHAHDYRTLHRSCDSLASSIGQQVCVSPPGSTTWDVTSYSTPTPTKTFTMFTGWEDGPAPTPVTHEPSFTAMPTYDVPTHTVTLNMTKQSMLVAYSQYCPLTNQDYEEGYIYADLSENCEDLFDKYCHPDLSKRKPTPTTFPTSCFPWRTSVTPTDITITGTAPSSTGAPTPSPIMEGTTPDCTKYHKVESGDNCYSVANQYGITLDNFYSWNPGVGDNCSTLFVGYYVCVGVRASTSSSIRTTAATAAPSPTMKGTTSNCDEYHKVESGDGCYAIAKEYGISLNKFYSWNRGVGDNCSALFLGYYVCVGVSNSSTIKPSPTKTAGNTAPSPTMPGTTTTCKKYHEVISGDGCYAIAQEYGITLDKFYSWNPSVGNDCSSLWLGYYVCVAV